MIGGMEILGKLLGTNYGQCGAIHFRAVVTGDATAWAAANLYVIQSMPLSAHATGKDAEVLDEAVNLIVGPRADATHRQAINSGHDLGAESIGIYVIPLGAVASLAFGMATLTQIELVAHDISRRCQPKGLF